MPQIFDTNVAIIGAGLAGLSAAARLQSLAIRTLVLEAQPHPGGRVCTHSLAHSKHNIELGATWFHGTISNAALDIAIEANLLERPSYVVDEDISYTTLVLSTPAKLIKHGVVTTISPEETMPIAAAYVAALKQLEDRDSFSRSDFSVQEYLKEKLNWASMTARQQAVFTCCDLLEATVNGCDAGTQDLSATRVNDYRMLDGDNFPAPQGGMTSLINALLSKLSDDTLMLNAEVVRVSWRDNEESFRPSVTLRNGDVVRCDCIIWTPSLNVTKKACRTSVFQPDLPLEKKKAMEGRMQGVVEKGFAVLEGRLQGVATHCAIPVLWEEHGLDGNGEHDVRTPSDWTRGIYALTYDPDRQTVGFWPSGRFAEHFCKLGEEEARQQVEQMLCMVYEQKVCVKKLIRSFWARNDFVLGSYTFPKVGCPAAAVRDLASPVPSALKPTLCFAGEATHSEFYSTMHGAVESGLREADRCVGYFADR